MRTTLERGTGRGFAAVVQEAAPHRAAGFAARCSVQSAWCMVQRARCWCKVHGATCNVHGARVAGRGSGPLPDPSPAQPRVGRAYDATLASTVISIVPR